MNSDLAFDVGVGVDTSNTVYGAGYSNHGPAVVKFEHAKGPGKNLGLMGLQSPDGVIIDDKYLIISDNVGGGAILIYSPGQKSPSSTISVPYPDRSALNRAENEIYAPESPYYGVGVYDYPGGTFVTTIPIGGFTTGAALSPAPNH